jgi:hypothetical protein
MGFQSTATTETLTAKLTPLGRQLIVTNTNTLITKFALGDSDANYNSPLILSSGEVPSMGGEIGANNSTSNSVSNDTAIRYPLYVDSIGGNTKSVDSKSITINSSLYNNGQVVNISGSNITHFSVNVNNGTVDNNVNLFSTFGLPITQNQKNTFTATTLQSGGWSDTALSGLAADNIIVVGIADTQYGEALDGKEIKLNLVTSAGTFTVYSTFQNKNQSLLNEDATYKDTATNTIGFGRSVSFLVSDDIMTPNGGDVTKSWATGFGWVKPFSVGKKELYNLRTNTNIAKSADTVCGVAYLDKGLLVITEPTIVNAYNDSFSGSSGTSITINSVSTDVVQNITCIAGRGEFGTSSNPTWAIGDPVRISEIGIYDNLNRLIAYGKFDRHIEKTSDGFMAFGINIKM